MKINKCVFLIAIFIILFFSDVLAQFFSPFAYVDELLAIAATLIIIINIKKQEKPEFILMMLIMILIGLLSNFCSGLKTNTFAIIVDAFTMFKAFIIYIGFNSVVDNKKDSKNLIKVMTIFCKIFSIIAFLFLILNYISLVDMTERIRYGLKEYRFIFINAGSFGYFTMALLPFLEKDKKNCLFVALLLLLIASTLKGPQLIFVALYLYYKLVDNIKNNKKVIRILLLPVLVLGILYISKYQINNYILNKSSARYMLTENAFKTANDYFPLGSGFATYGSEMSRRYYSPLYYKYHFNTIYGLSHYSGSYINDNYWQMVMAQLGYFGFALNIVFMFMICKNILYKMKNSKYYSWTKSMLICMLISSIGSAYITGCVFCTFMFAICLLNGELSDEREKH